MTHSRRKALKAGLAFACAAPAAGLAASEPDAELIRLCAEFDVLERQAVACEGNHPCGSPAEQAEEAKRAKLVAQQEELIDRIVDLPCLTPAGVYALGHSLAGYLSPEELEDEHSHYKEDRLLAAMLRSITREQSKPAASVDALPAPATATPPSPDAALIALCARYIATERRYHAISAQSFEFDFPDPEWEPLDLAARALVPSILALREQITETPALTLDGVRAKANASRYWLTLDTETARPKLMREEDALAWSLVQDVLRAV